MSFETKFQELALKINNKAGKVGKKTIDQLSAEVDTLLKPTGTINITSGGTVDVTNYASANVNIPLYTTQNALPDERKFYYSSTPVDTMTMVSNFIYPRTSVSGFSGLGGSNFYLLFTLSNVDDVTSLKTGTAIPDKTLVLVGEEPYTYNTSSTWFYTNYYYVYFNQAERKLNYYVNPSTTVNIISNSSSTTNKIKCLLDDIIVKSSGTPSVTEGSFSSRSGTSQYRFCHSFADSDAVKPQFYFANRTSGYNYYLYRGFYFVSTTLNVIYSAIV